MGYSLSIQSSSNGDIQFNLAANANARAPQRTQVLHGQNGTLTINGRSREAVIASLLNEIKHLRQGIRRDFPHPEQLTPAQRSFFQVRVRQVSEMVAEAANFIDHTYGRQIPNAVRRNYRSVLNDTTWKNYLASTRNRDLYTGRPTPNLELGRVVNNPVFTGYPIFHLQTSDPGRFTAAIERRFLQHYMTASRALDRVRENPHNYSDGDIQIFRRSLANARTLLNSLSSHPNYDHWQAGLSALDTGDTGLENTLIASLPNDPVRPTRLAPAAPAAPAPALARVVTTPAPATPTPPRPPAAAPTPPTPPAPLTPPRNPAPEGPRPRQERFEEVHAGDIGVFRAALTIAQGAQNQEEANRNLAPAREALASMSWDNGTGSYSRQRELMVRRLLSELRRAEIQRSRLPAAPVTPAPVVATPDPAPPMGDQTQSTGVMASVITRNLDSVSPGSIIPATPLAAEIPVGLGMPSNVENAPMLAVGRTDNPLIAAPLWESASTGATRESVSRNDVQVALQRRIHTLVSRHIRESIQWRVEVEYTAANQARVRLLTVNNTSDHSGTTRTERLISEMSRTLESNVGSLIPPISDYRRPFTVAFSSAE